MEPPRGIKANMLKSYSGFTDDFLSNNTKVSSCGGTVPMFLKDMLLFYAIDA